MTKPINGRRKINMDVSIIIATWNQKKSLRHCLRSVYGSDFEGSFEVIVVDNGSRDGSGEMAAKEFPKAILIENNKNLGVSKSRNQAFNKMRGKYGLLLDDDAVLTKNCLKLLVGEMDAVPRCGIAGPKIIYPDGRLQYSCRSFPDPISVGLRGFGLDKIFPDNHFLKKYLLADFDHQSTREVDWLMSACLIVRKEIIDEIGGFDEKYFFGGEDADFCLMARRKGGQVLYFPRALAIHEYQRKSARGFNRFALEHAKSLCRFFWKLYF
jgi:GT2 family glycosyltransferase